MCLIFLLNDLACFSFRSAAAAEPVQQSLQKNLNPHRGSGQADIDEGQIESGNKKWRVFLCAARAVVLSRACNEVGHGRSPCAFSRRFWAVKSGAAGGGSFHDLRHTFATMALQNGVDVKTVSSMASSRLYPEQLLVKENGLMMTAPSPSITAASCFLLAMSIPTMYIV